MSDLSLLRSDAEPGALADVDPLVGEVHPDYNREPTEIVDPAIDLNRPEGVVIDQNTLQEEDRGSNKTENEAAQAVADSTPGDPEADWLGDRLGGNAINTPRSVYLFPDNDLVDEPTA